MSLFGIGGRFINTLSERTLFISVRRGLTLMIPLMIIGAFAVFINNLPIPAYQQFMVALFGPDWLSFGTYVHQGTFAIMAVGMLLTISYSVANTSHLAVEHEVNPIIASIVSLACLFTVIQVEDGLLNFNWLGPLGVFLAIVISGLSVYLFLYFNSLNWLKVRVYSNAADPTITQAITSLLPALLTVSIFALLHCGLVNLGIGDLFLAMNQGVKSLFDGMSSSLTTALVFVALIHLSWFFGIHGNNALEPVTQSLFVPALEVNQQLMAAGMPPTEIFTKQFFDVFVFLGGSGATLCLIMALLISVRRSNTRQIALISTLPSIFNVNEIMVFGVPIVFNFFLFIPFILLPVILTTVSYLAMVWGWVPLTVASVEWTTPILLGGALTTGSIAGALLQLFNFGLGIVVYLPFISMYERHLAKGEENTLQQLLHEVNSRGEKQETVLLNRRDSVGNMARLLASDLERDLHSEAFRLEYQPQVNADHQIIGMEALLRWKHESYGDISPTIAIALAEETGLIHELGIWVIRSACQHWKFCSRNGVSGLSMSINITPAQLDDEGLPPQIAAILSEAGIPPRYIELEITEQAALGGLHRLNLLHELKGMGLRLAMDDFGMGHSSLMYLKELNLDTIKLDGSLVREILSNDKCREIISSIVQLGRSMGMEIIAEYVEHPLQQSALHSLGCYNYQGFLYSRSLTSDDFISYYHSFMNSQSAQGA